MKPKAIPVEIEYARGIIMIVINAGIAIAISSHSISLSWDAIKIPTIIKAGAVTAEVMYPVKGSKNIDRIKRIPVNTEVNPVRPPVSTPDNDSIYDVVVEVPAAAPTTVAIASANKALLEPSSSPSSLSKPALLPTVTNVPAVSKKSINRKVNITTKNLKSKKNQDDVD